MCVQSFKAKSRCKEVFEMGYQRARPAGKRGSAGRGEGGQVRVVGCVAYLLGTPLRAAVRSGEAVAGTVRTTGGVQDVGG